jgi:hypothetical protein
LLNAHCSLLEAHRFYAAERIFLPLQRRTALAFANNQSPADSPARAETEDVRLRKDQLEVLAKNA